MSARHNKKRQTPPPPAAPRQLTDAERAELHAYAVQERARPHAPRFNGLGGDNVAPVPGDDEALFRARLAKTVGSVDEHAIGHLLSHAAYATEGADVATNCNAVAALAARRHRAARRGRGHVGRADGRRA